MSRSQKVYVAASVPNILLCGITIYYILMSNQPSGRTYGENALGMIIVFGFPVLLLTWIQILAAFTMESPLSHKLSKVLLTKAKLVALAALPPALVLYLGTL